MPIGFNENTITTWKNQLAQGHTVTWLATAITVWAAGVVIFSWWIAAKGGEAAKYVLAAALLYEVLP